jgi:hypothetical protein
MQAACGQRCHQVTCSLGLKDAGVELVDPTLRVVHFELEGGTTAPSCVKFLFPVCKPANDNSRMEEGGLFEPRAEGAVIASTQREAGVTGAASPGGLEATSR